MLNLQYKKPIQPQSQNPPVIRHKEVYGVDISEFEFYCIKMISDYLFLDRFNDCASFVRFEQCFGPLFSPKNKQFKLVEAFKEIVGPKRKYLTFKRIIKAYLKWKAKKSNNYSFNFFMSEVFLKMIKKKGEVVGELIQGQLLFSTKNCRNRKIITKFSVLTDEDKNKIKGFIIEYDSVFKAYLCRQKKFEEINLEINFDLFHTEANKKKRGFQLDRDGISHIAGKYNETTKKIKFLIFKCRSGKTLYIGDSNEEETDKIVPFIFGSSKCQLKSLLIELIDNELGFIEPKYQLSTRKNENINIDFDYLNEKFLENDPPKFEEVNLDKLPENELKNDKKLLRPLIPDDQFVDKMSLIETKYGKDFKEVYTSFFDKEEKNAFDKFKDNIKTLVNEGLNKEKREELYNNENNRLRNSYFDKNNFESVFVRIIKLQQKKLEDEKKNQDNEENDEYIIEEDEEDNNLNLEEIESGVYKIKEQKVHVQPQLLEKKEKEPLDNMSKSKVKDNSINLQIPEALHTPINVNKENVKKESQDNPKNKLLLNI